MSLNPWLFAYLRYLLKLYEITNISFLVSRPIRYNPSYQETAGTLISKSKSVVENLGVNLSKIIQQMKTLIMSSEKGYSFKTCGRIKIQNHLKAFLVCFRNHLSFLAFVA